MVQEELCFLGAFYILQTTNRQYLHTWGPVVRRPDSAIRAVTIDAINGGGGGVNIHIIMFPYRKNNRFQKKSVGQNTSI